MEKHNAHPMTLDISCSELTVNDSVPLEHADTHGFVFVTGMKAVDSRGRTLFSVSGSDEYGATINNVQSYSIIKDTFNHGFVVAKVEESYDMAIKTEHNGAKNGGGYWGLRKDAKKISKRLRRIFAKQEIERSHRE